jgi:hypothetical protein
MKPYTNLGRAIGDAIARRPAGAHWLVARDMGNILPYLSMGVTA